MNKKVFINILLTLVLGVILYYFMLPPLNLTAPAFYVFVVFLVIIYFVLSLVTMFKPKIRVINNKFEYEGKFPKIILVIPVMILIIMVVNLALSPIFNSESYANRMYVNETGIFTDDIAEVNFSSIPLLDKESSRKLGDRTMGQMADLVSQFDVSNLYTQINFNADIVRVTPLEYSGIIKYFTNRKNGVEGYIVVNSTNGESSLVRLEKGMKYMPSAAFFENLDRKLRMQYPTEIFGESSFEIDNEGNPYWITPLIKYKGIGLKKEIKGIVVTNPVTGKSEKYNIGSIPTWIDHVYDANLIIEQFNNWGEYKNGFWNSIFGQKNVVNTTEGYNYLAMNDDIYLYTGVTSVVADESNLGFILTNMRTKETNFYSVPGAEEYSAMASAEGLVQEKNYKASFPLLINLNNKPTYLMSLKDNAGLVKMYALVDVVDYQKVVTSDASLGIEVAANKYLMENPATDVTGDLVEATIEIRKVTTAVIDGTTYYYFMDRENNVYSASIKINKDVLPFIEVGNTVNIAYTKTPTIGVIAIIKK